ncbi:MAG: c-type cytochrome [Candidatus Omnitrophica bacterium]|nr:c-type cytochrome [Candidatus Omnitrophota bacterium]
MGHRRSLSAARALLAGLISIGGWALAPRTDAAKPEPDPAAGRAAFEQHCARCHGPQAAGDGYDAKRLYPRPRDLTEGVFKFRSTATGTAPADEDLFRTLTDGLPGSGMPDWRHLDEAVRWQLVYYIKSLSPVFEDSPAQPVDLGRDPGRRRVDLAAGKQVYEKLRCAACHGAQGRADGTSAPSLVDNWGRATRPADLTQGWNYRGGSDPKAIVTRVLAGIDGTPMPSYAEATTPEEAWQLAYYVRSLQQEPNWSMIVRAPRLDGGLPSSLDDPRWQQAPRVEVRLRNAMDEAGEWARAQTISTVSFRAAQDGQSIRFLVSWQDPTDDRGDAPDALALALPSAKVLGDSVTLQLWPMRSSPPLDLCVWSAASSRAVEGVVRRYEPLLQAGGASAVPIEAASAYADGQWQVMLTRPLAPALPNSARAAPGRLTPVAFAVWDGGNGGQRATSSWVDVMMEAAPPSTAAERAPATWLWILAAGVVVLGLVWIVKKPQA